jgi:hypothetical protein
MKDSHLHRAEAMRVFLILRGDIPRLFIDNQVKEPHQDHGGGSETNSNKITTRRASSPFLNASEPHIQLGESTPFSRKELASRIFAYCNLLLSHPPWRLARYIGWGKARLDIVYTILVH